MFTHRMFTSCVALTITAAALNAQQREPSPPTLILVGGKVFTADSTRPWAEAVALRDERIVAVGANRDIVKLAGPATQRVDVGGRVIVPGFNDAHAHVGCWNSSVVPLLSSNDPMPDPPFAVLADSLRAVVPRTPEGTWLAAIVGRTAFEDHTARRVTLDQIAPRHPVALVLVGGHEGLLNSAALRVLGVRDTARDPVGGSYEREPGSARLNGLLHEYAIFSATRRFCSLEADSTLVRALHSQGRDWLRLGITSIQSFNHLLDPARLMRTVQAAELPQRVRIIPMPSTSATGRNLDEWKTALALPRVARNAAGGSITVSGVKWILDGTPIERGAAHRTVYRDRPGHFGKLNFPPDTIRAILLEARAARQQALLHAGGDSTLAVILDVMEKTGGAPVWRAERVRIEHGDALLPDLQGRARDLAMVVVQNPTHFALPGLLSVTYDSATTAAFQPLRTLVSAGIPVALGADAMGAAMSPFLNIMFATTHPNNPGEALTREQAVTAYTRGSAYAEMAEAEKGTLAPGMLADLAVLSQDIFTVPAPQLAATTSVLTVIGGRIVHDELTTTGAAVKRR
jgi:predicted amidohydrolase YtcJ